MKRRELGFLGRPQAFSLPPSLLASFAILAVFALVACARCPGGGEVDWQSRLAVSLEEDTGGNGGLRLVLQGVSGWYVNKLYPSISVELDASPILESSPTTLGRDDVVFERSAGEDRAERAVFSLSTASAWRVGGQEPEPETIRGSYRAVVCKGDACSPPFSDDFSLELPRE